MSREEEKLKAIDDNAQLALEFTKEFNECIEKQVPKECAALAALQDLADWKDKHPRKGLWDANKVLAWISQNIESYCKLDAKNFNNLLFDLEKAMED